LFIPFVRTTDEQSPLSYLKCFAEAEMEGYTIDEILLGILCVPFRDLNNWLKNTYSTMLDGVIQTVDTTQQVSHGSNMHTDHRRSDSDS